MTNVFAKFGCLESNLKGQRSQKSTAWLHSWLHYLVRLYRCEFWLKVAILKSITMFEIAILN